MTFEFASWFGRAPLTADRSAPNGQRDDREPLKIEVERMPDYLWRALGFPQPQQRDEER
jgi:hypothetical protein